MRGNGEQRSQQGWAASLSSALLPSTIAISLRSASLRSPLAIRCAAWKEDTYLRGGQVHAWWCEVARAGVGSGDEGLRVNTGGAKGKVEWMG